MQVHQRTGTTQVTTADAYVLDGWSIETRVDSYDATWSQSTTVPAGQGFKYSLKCDVNGTATPSGSGNYLLRQNVEGTFLNHLNSGTSEAKTLTVSFWVRSSKTGIYCFQIRDVTPADHVLIEYTINSADTWEHKVLTFTGNTSGTATATSGSGYDIHWHLASGPDDHTSATSNAFGDNSSGLFRTTSNQVNLFDSATAEWYITGVQFEVGNQASEFEHLPFDIQLERCRRYLQRIEASGTDYGTFGSGSNANSTSCIFGKQFSPEMRATPTLITTGTAANYSTYNPNQGVDACTSVPALNGGGATKEQCRLEFISSGNLVAGEAGECLSSDGVTAFLMFSAELQ
jgi:hypothetical protein